MKNNFIKEGKKQAIKYFNAFEDLLKKGNEFGVEINDIDSKLAAIKETLHNGKIKVALVGGFSEGKTTLAASWLGNLEETMKIDPDESSDDIQIYRPQGLEKDCEIIDTPGLYGAKSLDDGTKFKELTLKYVSEAHLVLFVLDPVNPIKDSHKETIKWLFRDLNKINSVIFVLNKMDEVANLTDPEDFQEVFDIKKKNIEDTLDRMIGLSLTEKEALLITAVSANPKNKGLEFWFNRNEDYLNRSRIDNLRGLTNNLLSKSKNSLVKNTNLSVIRDILIKQNEATMPIINKLAQSIESRKDILTNIQNDYNLAEKKINSMKPLLREELIAYKVELLNKFNGSDISTFPQYVTEEIGEEAINFQSRITSIVERYINEVNGLSNSLIKSFESEIDFAENLLEKHNNLIKNGLKGLKSIPVNQWHSIINNSRNVLNGTFGTAIKFKPWGITKLAKGASGAMAGIGVGVEIWETISTIRKKGKFEKARKEIIDLVTSTINEQIKITNDQDEFIKTFAPNLIELKNQINNIGNTYNQALKNRENIQNWMNSVQNFSFENIEEVSYEEVID